MGGFLNHILGYARNEDRIRAVYLGGSRTDPSVAPDPFQDYDVVFVVDDPTVFISDQSWIDNIGKPAMVQEPDKPEYGWGQEEDGKLGYAWLMILDSGIRIDLGIQAITICLDRFMEDDLHRVLLDKDGLLPTDHISSGATFWHKPPTENEYLACCNEFWWCLNNVAKANARGQYPMAVSSLESPVRDMLMEMLGWYTGMWHDWRVSIGKQGKFLGDLLSAEDFAQVCATYPHADRDDIWRAIHAITILFRQIAVAVGDAQGFTYPAQWDESVSAWLAAMERGELPGEMQLP